MKKVVLTLAALVAAYYVFQIAIPEMRESKQAAAEARELAQEQERRAQAEAHARARERNEGELRAATEDDIRRLARDCASAAPVGAQTVFVAIAPSDFSTVKSLALRKVPMDTFGISTTLDSTVDAMVGGFRQRIANGYIPRDMQFIMLSTGEGFSGSTKILSLYGCDLDGLAIRPLRRIDRVPL